MPFIDVFFDEFLPDLGGAPHNKRLGYLTHADQVRKVPGGYRPIQASTTVASAATLPASGLSYSFLTGINQADPQDQDIFFANTTDLYQSNDKGQSWNTVTGAATNSGAGWSFSRFDDRVIAYPGGSNVVQSKTLGAAVTSAFATLSPDLSGGSSIDSGDRIRDHLVIATLGGVRWSSIGDPTSFPTPGSATAIANQSGSQTMPLELGRTRIVSGGEKFGLIFSDLGITRMTYRGTIGTVYEFDTFEKEQGMFGQFPYQGRVVQAGSLFYFTNINGMWVTDGYQVRNLSRGKIEAALFADILSHELGEFHNGFSGIFDSEHQNVIFKSQSPSGWYGLVYSITEDAFSTITATQGNQVLMYGRSSPTDWKGRVFERDQGSSVLSEWAQSTSIPVTMQTAYMELKPGRRIQLEGAHLLGSQHSTPTLAYKVADDYANVDIATSGYTTMTSPARDIKFTARDTGRFLSFRVTGNQDAKSLLQGLRVYYSVSQTK